MWNALSAAGVVALLACSLILPTELTRPGEPMGASPDSAAAGTPEAAGQGQPSLPMSPRERHEATLEAMQRLDFLLGDWEGEALIPRRRGAPRRFQREEHVQWKLNGAILMIESIQRDLDDEERPAIESLAVMTYDADRERYVVREFAHDATWVDAEVRLGDRELTWTFKDRRERECRRFIWLDDAGAWQETREYLAPTDDGRFIWVRDADMTLQPHSPRR